MGPTGELCGRRTQLTSQRSPSAFKVNPSPTLGPAFSHCPKLLSICQCIDYTAFFFLTCEIRGHLLWKNNNLQIQLHVSCRRNQSFPTIDPLPTIANMMIGANCLIFFDSSP
ncbi:hypothetical protein AVEN_14806-1 [Araneus ventricosus]|uniref:Uncharacterized protein n=1 Tax=Araneus ventricosus TaxID=182803 RepID=A0A4Y2FKA4_ARAVE|nr:hypothetical protein AVEN_14806-1 [Araneus ventricosus]